MNARVAAVVLGLVSSAWAPPAAERAPLPWRIAEPVRRAVPSCAAIEPRVLSSDARGITVRVRMEGGAERPCRVAITAASLELGTHAIAAARLPPAPALTSANVVLADVPFLLDPGAAVSDAALVLWMSVDGEPAGSLRWSLDQALDVPSRP